MNERGPGQAFMTNPLDPNSRPTTGAEMRASIKRRFRPKRKEHLERFGVLAHGVDAWKTLHLPLKENAASTIWQQLGRSRFMIGAKNPVRSNADQTLTFRIGRNSKSINWVRISLSHSDTYDVEFGRGYKKPRVVNTVDGVYADQLANVIGSATGMAVTL